MRQLNYLLILLVVIVGSVANAQPRMTGSRGIILDDNAGNEAYITTSLSGVGINGLNMPPNACAILDLSSQTKGFLPPRMVPAEIAALCGGAPPEGLIVYNTLTHTLDIWNGSTWTGQWQTKGNTNLSSDNVDNLLGSTAISSVKPFNLIVDGVRIMRYETNNRIQGGYPGNTISGLVNGAIIAGGGNLGQVNTIGSLGHFDVIGGGRGNTANGDLGAGDATIGGGIGNTAAGARTTIGGGFFNTANNNASTIGGGANNTTGIIAQYATVAGGNTNTNNSVYGSIGGGILNQILSTGASNTIGGGQNNTILVGGNAATIGGGAGNQATNFGSTVGGGDGNQATALRSTVGGGRLNIATVDNAVVAGGEENQAIGYQSSVGGGTHNVASGAGAHVGGGGWLAGPPSGNTASGQSSAITGGVQNRASDDFTFVGGGQNNQAGNNAGPTNDRPFATVGGGQNNTASGIYATVGGGANNNASANNSTIGGGRSNTTSGTGATIAGGGDDGGVTQGNTAAGNASSILGGLNNRATDNYTVVGGGQNNQAGDNAGTIADRTHATVSGGQNNTASGQHATVGGGNVNTANGAQATVGGGQNNTASGTQSTVGGGIDNTASGIRSTIAGGINNQATVQGSSVGGGWNNIAINFGSIGGGEDNQMTGGDHGTIAGGRNHRMSGINAFIGGGASNSTSGSNSVITGGSSNIITGALSAITGGQNLTLGTTSFGYNVANAADISGQSGIAYFGNVDVLLGNTDNTAQQLRFYENNGGATLAGADFASFQAPAVMNATTQYALPVNYGTSGIAPYFLADVTGVGTPRQLTWVSGNSSNWLLTGNSGTNSAVNFIGTTDAADFIIKTGAGAIERMRFDGNPQLNSSTDPLIRITNTVPNQQGLRIEGTTDAIPGFGGSTLGANPGVWDLAVVGDAVVTGVTKMGTSLWFDGISTPHSIKANQRTQIGTLTNNDLALISNNIERMYVDSTGKIGIGTKDPVSFLHVRGVPPTVDSVNGAGMLIPRPVNHLVTIENVSTDEKGNGIAIILNATGGIGPPQDVHVNNNQNYITFYNEPNAKAIRGRIEGFSWQNYWNTIDAVADFALDHALDFANPLNYLTFNLDFFDFDPNFISFDPNFLTFNANFINFSGGSFPTLTGGSLPSLTGGSFSFTDGITWPTFNAGSWPTLTTGSLPSISWSAPVVLNGSPFIINGSPITNLEYPIGLNWDYLNEIFGFVANLPYKDKIAEFVTNRPAAAMKFAANFFGGVTYESGSGDYAEWLERANPAEKIMPGDIVGINGGKISKNTEGTNHFMVATWKPIVLGNMPPEDREQDFTKVAFLGQVPVKIKGGCRKGDYILPSGLNDGFARALNPSSIDAADLDKILGVAWDDTYETGATFAKVAVGLKPTEMATVIQKQQRQIEILQDKVNEIELLKQEMAELKEAVSASASSKVVSAKKSTKKSKFRYKTVSSK